MSNFPIVFDSVRSIRLIVTTGDRSLPLCSSCAKTNRDFQCLYIGIKVRQSSYSEKAYKLLSRRRRKLDFTGGRSDESMSLNETCVVYEDYHPPNYSNPCFE